MLDDELGLQTGFKSIEQLMREQGTRARTFEEMLVPVTSEEADDDVDEFLKDLYRGYSVRILGSIS